MKRTILIFGLLSLILSSCSNNKNKFDATGTFETTEVIVCSEAIGKILSFDIEEGDIVKAGQQIGIIDTIQLALQKKQLMTNAQSIDMQRPDIITQLASLKDQISQAKKDKQRLENLVVSKVANQKDLDDVNSKIKILSSQLAATQSSLDKSNRSLLLQSSSVGIQVEQIDDKLSKCRISSPIDGTILTKYVNKGEYASTGKPMFKVSDINNIYLRAYITNAQLTQIKIGQKVKVYADKGNKDYKEYEGIITWISASAEFTPKTIQTKDERENLVYAIKVLVVNDGFIKRGMYGEVKF